MTKKEIYTIVIICNTINLLHRNLNKAMIIKMYENAARFSGDKIYSIPVTNH